MCEFDFSCALLIIEMLFEGGNSAYSQDPDTSAAPGHVCPEHVQGYALTQIHAHTQGLCITVCHYLHVISSWLITQSD